MLKLLLEGGYEILLKETWQSYYDALHEIDGDPEVILKQSNEQFIAVNKDKIVAVANIEME